MARPHERIFAIVAALLFLGTSVGFSAVVIWQIHKDSQASKPSPQTNQQKEANMLQGTKLTDFTPTNTVDTLQVQDLTVGTGEEAKADSTVTAHYTGALTKDGTIFESSLDQGRPATFPLSNVIKGWQQGVPGMKVGGKRRLLIPASLAYGEQGSPPKIGPNEPLVFDIELIKIGK